MQKWDIAGYAIFAVALLVGNLVFSVHFKKKSYFILRYILGSEVVLAVTALLGVLRGQIAPMTFSSYLLVVASSLLVIMLTSFLVLWACYDERPYMLLLAVISSYAVNHIGLQLAAIVVYFKKSAFDWLSVAIAIWIYVLLYAGSYFFLLEDPEEKLSADIPREKVIILFAVGTLSLLLFSTARDFLEATNAQKGLSLGLLTRLASLGFALFILIVRRFFLIETKTAADKALQEAITRQKLEQYETEKQTIDLVNVKCHDLRKRIREYGDRAGLGEEERKELSNAIRVYDNTLRTGSSVLDVILTERSLLCDRENIRFSCIADGELLDFMPPQDVYAIVANALDNAIEAVRRVEEGKEKSISLQIRETMGMISITVDNTRPAGEVKLKEGLPRTTHSDETIHGYGMRSIRMTAKRYGGELSFTPEEGSFHLSVLLPKQAA